MAKRQTGIMADAEALAALPSTYSKGLNIARNNVLGMQVRIFDGIHHVRGEVQGSTQEPYEVGADLDLEKHEIEYVWCTCPAARKYDGLCKHEIGLIARYLATTGEESVPELSSAQAARGTQPVRVTSDEAVEVVPVLPSRAYEYLVDLKYEPAKQSESATPFPSRRTDAKPKAKPKKPKVSEPATDRSVLGLIAGMAGDGVASSLEKRPSLARTVDETDEPAKLALTFSPDDDYHYTQATGRDQTWTVKLRVSRGKSGYLVKHVDEFVRAWQSGSMLTHGKKLSFVHGPDAFDERSNELLRVLARIVSAQEAAVPPRDYWNGRHPASSSTLNVSGNDLVDLLDTQQGTSVTFDPGYSGYDRYGSYGSRSGGGQRSLAPSVPRKATIPVRQGNPKLTVHVALADAGGYELTVEGAYAAISGGSGLYAVMSDAVTRCTDAFRGRLGRFCETMLPCERPYHIRENDMQGFAGFVLPVLEGLVELDLAPGVADMAPPPAELAFRIYTDGGLVLCVASVSYGERTMSLFERARQGQPVRDIARESEAQRVVRQLFPCGLAPLPDYADPAPSEGTSGFGMYSYEYRYGDLGYVRGTAAGRYGPYHYWAEARRELGLAQGMAEPSAPWFAEDDVESLCLLMDEGLAELDRLGEVYVSQDLARIEVRDTPDVRVRAQVSGGLLDLDVELDGLSAADVMAYLAGYQQHRRYVRLSNGDIMRLGEGLGVVSELADGLGLSMERLAKGGEEVPANRTLFVDALLKRAGGVRLDRDAGFRRIVRDFDTIADADFDEPASLRQVLRPYQLEGFKWLSTLARTSFGGILADDMGLGKTLQVLSFLLARREGDSGQVTEGSVASGERPSPALVVCPASLVYNWIDEASKFVPALDAVPVLGTKRERMDLIDDAENHDLLVTSYDLMRRDIDEYEGQRFGVVVLDEAQYIKNANTQAARCAKRLVADQRFACTGTPVENNLGELWSIFDFLMPGILGSRDSFRKRFERPISAGDEGAAHRLQCLVGPFILRRLKADVLRDLPEKNESVVYATMAGEQGRLYKANEARIALTLAHQMPQEFAANRIAILAELTRLRQVCCDPHLAYDNYRGGSAKLETCLELVRSAIDGGHRVLLFSQFTSMLDIIAGRLAKERVGYLMLTGSTSKKERARLVSLFQAGQAPVFLISLKAGGVGLNLTAADVVIHYDPWWNLAAQNQATDRAHRIGQKREVTVLKLIAKDSIEERILKMQEAKGDLAEAVLGGEAAGSTKLTRDDVLALLDAGTDE